MIINTPLSRDDILHLKAGTKVSISGIMYTARDAAHKRMIAALNNGEELPFDPRGQIIYYVGPTPAASDRVIGSAGPTTSGRMDSYVLPLLEKGLKGMIGKGLRNEEVVEGCRKHDAVYFAAIGGIGALLSRCIIQSEVIAYEDLGPEAVRRIRVNEFPAVVINDMYGNDLYRRILNRSDS